MRNKLIISFFCVLLAVCALAWLFIPDKYYSEREKRTLAQKPAFTAAASSPVSLAISWKPTLSIRFRSATNG
mgnify:CR=1 FL=1